MTFSPALTSGEPGCGKSRYRFAFATELVAKRPVAGRMFVRIMNVMVMANAAAAANSRRLLLAAILSLVSLGAFAAESDSWRSKLIGKLRHGDIVYRRGIGQISDAIATVAVSSTGKPARWTHVGIAVQLRPGGKLYILHAVDKRGVTLDAPETFFSPPEAAAGSYQRVKSGAQIAQAAMAYLGRPFDKSFSLEEHDFLYCSELLLLALKDVGVKANVAVRRVPLIGLVALPDDLSDALSRLH